MAYIRNGWKNLLPIDEYKMEKPASKLMKKLPNSLENWERKPTWLIDEKLPNPNRKWGRKIERLKKNVIEIS